ncbi:MAG: thrombospondin type 3 repeat-containing protein [Verrucomicrobiia bacterium]
MSTQAIYYVDANGTNPDVPYTSWGTAARIIQDSADVAIPLPGSLVLVTNGTYQAGGRVITSITNRLAVTKPIAVQSVNGPAATIIEGYQIPGATNGAAAVRCAYLTNGAVLAGFWLTNGATAASNSDLFGGGVYCVSTNVVVSNCVITANSAVGAGGGAYSGQFSNCSFIGNRSGAAGGAASASLLFNCILSGNRATSGGGAQICTLNDCALYSNSATGGNGGGAINSTLNNCILSGNSAFSGGGASGGMLNNCLLATNSSNNGGGALSATLINCTLALNSGGEQGGGVSSSTLKNCVVYGNSAVRSSNYDSSVFTNCCTFPLPTNGLGNISNAPAFVDLVNGDFHLQSNSPCINAGNNVYVTYSTDFDGNPRIRGGTVDIGAYEYQTPTSVISYAWLQQYGLPTDGSADYFDSDGDGLNNWQEWIAGTNPTNALSVLKMASAAPTNSPPGLVVTWQSVNTRTYFLQSSTNLGVPPAFSTIQSNLVGQAGLTSYTDTTATNTGPYFYRVGVQ